MRFLVAGATGFLGRHLMAALTRARHDVVVLARKPARAATLFAGAKVVEWDGTTGAPPEHAFEGVDVVVNLIGDSLSKRWTEERKRSFRASRIAPARALANQLRNLAERGAGTVPPVYISMSGVALYGDRGAEVLTERSLPGTGFLAALAQEWEAAALEAEQAGVRVIVIRSGVVLGQDGGMLPRILPLFRLGLGARLGSGRQYFAWIHVDDAVRMLIHAAEKAELGGPVNAVAPEPVTNGEFTAALAEVLHRPAALAVPGFALKLGLGEMADELLLSSQRVSPIRALETGFEFRFPLLRAALGDLVGRERRAVAQAPRTSAGAE